MEEISRSWYGRSSYRLETTIAYKPAKENTALFFSKTDFTGKKLATGISYGFSCTMCATGREYHTKSPHYMADEVRFTQFPVARPWSSQEFGHNSQLVRNFHYEIYHIARTKAEVNGSEHYPTRSGCTQLQNGTTMTTTSDNPRYSISVIWDLALSSCMDNTSSHPAMKYLSFS